jgi:DNA-binding MarR family transcriptional regulator
MLKYLKLMDQVKQLNKQFDLSYHEIELLDLAAKAHFSEQPIFVGDLIHQRSIASQATLHAVFKGLVDKKLLSTKSHEEDGRIKKVSLTKASIEHYKRIHREINRASIK